MILENKTIPTRASRDRRYRPSVVGATLAALLLAVAGPSVTASASPKVVTAVGAENEYANVIAQIGGRYVHVDAVMKNPATDPHTYEASTSVAREVASAQLVVQNGVGYDQFMTQLESASPNRARRVIVVQTLLGLPATTPNPHLWYKTSAMSRVAAQIARELSSLAPTHAGYFSARLATFRHSMIAVASAIATFKSKYAGAPVATTEPVADYLLSALGLDNRTPFRFQADNMNGVDPSPQDISFQDDLLRHHRVKAFCFNVQVSNSVTLAMRSLARSSHVPVVAFYETMPAPGYDYQSWMLAEIAALTRALHTGASTLALS